MIGKNYVMSNCILTNKYKLFCIFLLFTCVLGVFPAQFMVISDIIIIYSILGIKDTKAIFTKPLNIFLIFLFINIVSCYYYEKQSILLSITNIDFITFFPFLSYFYMIRKRKNPFSIEDIEWNIKRFYFIIFFIFVVQYALLPYRIINLSTYIEEEKRFTIFGQIITIVAYFYFLNKYLITKKNKYMAFLLPEILIVFIQGFRIYILALIIVSALFIIKTGSFKKTIKLVSIAFIISLFLIQIPIVNNAISNMQNRQIDNNFSNEDYIRIRQFEYFTTEHFKSSMEYILGSGFSNIRSEYGKKMFYLQQLNNENQLGPIGGWRDWGMVGLSWMIGIPCMLCILYCIFIILKTHIPKQYLYLKYFYLFILLTSVTSVEFYRWGSVFIHGILFYLFEIIKKSEINNKILYENKNIIHSK